MKHHGCSSQRSRGRLMTGVRPVNKVLGRPIVERTIANVERGSVRRHALRENIENANQWADRQKNRKQYGYDADEEVEKWWILEGEKQYRRLMGDVDQMSPDTSTVASSVSKKVVIGKKSFWKRLFGKRIDDIIVRMNEPWEFGDVRVVLAPEMRCPRVPKKIG